MRINGPERGMRRNYSQRKDSMRRKKQDKGEKGKWETRVANSS